MILAIILAIENENDRELMLRIYREIYPLMKSTAYEIVENYSAAEDIVQDSIVKLIEKLPAFRSLNRAQMVTYICKTVKSTALDYYRRHMSPTSKVVLHEDDDANEKVEDDSSTACYKKIDDYILLGQALSQLSNYEKDILYYKYSFGYSDKEIAKIMGMTHNAVRVALSRARKKAKLTLIKAGIDNEH